jgi:hypothetical protein
MDEVDGVEREICDYAGLIPLWIQQRSPLGRGKSELPTFNRPKTPCNKPGNRIDTVRCQEIPSQM